VNSGELKSEQSFLSQALSLSLTSHTTSLSALVFSPSACLPSHLPFSYSPSLLGPLARCHTRWWRPRPHIGAVCGPVAHEATWGGDTPGHAGQWCECRWHIRLHHVVAPRFAWAGGADATQWANDSVWVWEVDLYLIIYLWSGSHLPLSLCWITLWCCSMSTSLRLTDGKVLVWFW
jgi:hypothetical protein